MVVENRAGAGGNIAAEHVARSAPDGYTLLMGNIGTHAVNVSLFAKLPFDPVRDFAPIAHVLEAEGLLVVHPSLPGEGARFMPNTPEQFGAFVKGEIVKWAPVVRASGARVD